MYVIQKKTLTNIADAIREKTGKSALMTPEEMVGEIEGIGSSVHSLLTVHGISHELLQVTKENVSLRYFDIENDNGETKVFYIIPEPGTWLVKDASNFVSHSITPIKFEGTNVYFYEPPFSVPGIGYLSTSKSDRCKHGDRNMYRVLGDGPILLWSAAKTSNGYIAPAFYTLHDYGDVYRVITGGSYTQKLTISLENPINSDQSVTVYAYGAFSGGYTGVTSNFYHDNVLYSSIQQNNDFFAPYGSDKTVYNNSPLEDRIKFWDALAYTA